MDGEAAGDIWVEAWLSIWVRPRATIRRIIDADPRKFAVGIAFVAGALAMVNIRASLVNAPMPHMHMRMPHIGPLGLALAALFMGAVNVAMLFLFGALYRWSGAMLGGAADAVQVRAALAWAQVPEIYLTVVGIIVTALGLAGAPAGVYPQHSAFGLIEGVVTIWAFVISLKCLGEVHGFSAWRALGSVLLGLLAVALVLIAVMITVHLAISAGRALA
jgi:hypothetical protein